MTRLSFIEGKIAVANKRRVEIVSIESSERIFCRDIKSGKTQYFAAGQLHCPKKNKKGSVKDSIILDEKERARATHRLEVLRPILPHKGKKRAQAIREQSIKYNVSRSTIYKWIRDYEQSGRKLSSLGNRKKANRKSSLKPSVLKILNETVTTYYETDQKPTLKQTVEEVQYQCRAKNLEPPSGTTIKSYIKLRDQRKQAQSRHGEKYAREQYDIAQGEFPHAHAPLDVGQMDHSLLDIILVDSSRRHIIGRPWLTAIIDVYSRMIAGFYLSFENPTKFLSGLCLAHAMLSKDLWLEKLGLDPKNWPVWGRIERLHVDNAMEFHSRGLEELCKEYGTDLEFRPVGKPHYGGIVERFFGTLEGYVHTLPGTTFSNPAERGEYKSEERATLTLDDLEKLFADWITSQYHITPHDGLQKRKPLEVWNEGINGTGEQVGRGIPDKIDSERDAIRICVMPTDTRVVTNKGIVWDYIYYKHINFSRLRGKKLTVKRDPRNLEFMWFYDEISSQWLRASYRDPTLPVVNLWELRLEISAMNKRGAKIDQHSIFEGIKRRKEWVDKASAESKKAKASLKKGLRLKEIELKSKSAKQSPKAAKTAGSKQLSVIPGGGGDDIVLSPEEDVTKIPIRIFEISKN